MFIPCRDIFSEHLAPLKLEFGYVCENPIEWEQRFERKDFDNNRFSGKVIILFRHHTQVYSFTYVHHNFNLSMLFCILYHFVN